MINLPFVDLKPPPLNAKTDTPSDFYVTPPSRPASWQEQSLGIAAGVAILVMVVVVGRAIVKVLKISISSQKTNQFRASVNASEKNSLDDPIWQEASRLVEIREPPLFLPDYIEVYLALAAGFVIYFFCLVSGINLEAHGKAFLTTLAFVYALPWALIKHRSWRREKERARLFNDFKAHRAKHEKGLPSNPKF